MCVDSEGVGGGGVCDDLGLRWLVGFGISGGFVGVGEGVFFLGRV